MVGEPVRQVQRNSAPAGAWRIVRESRLDQCSGCKLTFVDLDVPVSLLEDLHALAAISATVHGDVCSVFDPESPAWCSCGVPGMLRALAELMPLPEGARTPYRPSWVPSARAA